jgi:hypothetical protein
MTTREAYRSLDIEAQPSHHSGDWWKSSRDGVSQPSVPAATAARARTGVAQGPARQLVVPRCSIVA